MSAVVPEETLIKKDNIETQEANKEGDSNEKSIDNIPPVKNEENSKLPKTENVDKKKKKKSRRLSFADEHGQDLKEVTYHSNLHYSQGESDNDSPKANSGGCCIIS
eukprot:g5372.t1